jgi:hypothetical protein
LAALRSPEEKEERKGGWRKKERRARGTILAPLLTTGKPFYLAPTQ